ncbi:MAG TPA: hypothetical protein VFJ95_11035 [Gammaproteobacteria bacterium]|jgi:hypothetical protein|nr:hypothetical protein [Gammaproteobacteria bacterium]
MRKLPAALAALGIASVVFAQPPNRPPEPSVERGAAAERSAPRQGIPQPPRFEAVDKNGDGTLDRKEARAVDGLKFSAADEDGNSTIDPREYAIAMTKVLEGWRR